MIPRQTMQPVSNLFSLPRCKVELYESGADNELGALVWTAQQVDNLRVAQSFEEALEFLTGVPYPNTHHLLERNEIVFDASWNITASMQRSTEYILALTWEDAGLGASTVAWVKRFYAGVTTPSRDISSKQNEFGSSNVLRAKYFIETTGTSTPPSHGPGDLIC